MRNLTYGLIALFGATILQPASIAADGAKVFRKCKACHSATDEKNKVGPHLKGIVGRQVGTVTGYKYSKAMAAADYVWDEAALDAFLAKPRKHTPGTKMAFPGLKKPADRAAIIDYLKNTAS